MPWIANSLAVTRVSSATMASHSASTLNALSVMSLALPMGVAVTYRPGESAAESPGSPGDLPIGAAVLGWPGDGEAGEDDGILGAARPTPRGKPVLGLGVWAIAALMAIGAGLSACQTAPPPPPKPVVPAHQAHALPPRSDLPTYYRLAHTPTDHPPVRVALLLPFSNPSADTRALADAMEKAAELAMFESGNSDIIIMPRDEGGSPELAAQVAAAAIDDGAEIILGPLFSQSVQAMAPVARARGVPVIAFSSDRSVGGDGVYLLSFQPEDEVHRIVAYAARHGHSQFAALIPQTPYGMKVEKAFRDTVTDMRGKVVALEHFGAAPDLVAGPARTVDAANPDAVFIGQGGPLVAAIGVALAPTPHMQLLGTSLWNDPALLQAGAVNGGWFAAPPESEWVDFTQRYSAIYGARPPRIASLAYDAMSLVALLAKGKPYQRYSEEALTDPNGFSGTDGIFRFNYDGGIERGLAIMEVTPGGFRVVDPAPRSFQGLGS